MRRLLLLLLLACRAGYAQEEDLARIMEDQADQEDVKEVEEDLIQLRLFTVRPLNINTAGTEDLQVFPFLSSLQVEQLILYKKYTGDLVDVKELQAVPGWDANLVRKLLPYITVSRDVDLRQTFSESLEKGRHQFLLRSALSKNAGMLIRYHFSSPQMEWGLNLEKDRGERFWQGAKGISFLSAHALVRNMGVLKLLVVGDYIINIGQGLSLWQGRAVRKTGMPIMIKRQLPMAMPYRSNDENRYFRGAAAWFEKGKMESLIFISRNGLDANLGVDSGTGKNIISSFLNTGYHRNGDELADKNAVSLFSAGGSVAMKEKRLRVAVSSVLHMFSMPVTRAALPYNLYSSKGKLMTTHSMNYHYTWRNMHVFGEWAMDREADLAGMAGLMAAVDPKLDVSMAIRKMGKGYRSFFANAFTESSEPGNEEGVYAGISFRMNPRSVLDMYADHYRFPWLRYRVDAPGWGRDYLVQYNYKPDKKTLMYMRVRYEIKTANTDIPIIKTIGPGTKTSLRFHLQYKINMEWECRIRMELNEIRAVNIRPENGFVFYSDWFWNPLYRPFSFNGRIMVCETSSYASRIYAFENDVMFYNIVPVFFGKLGRLYINSSLNISKTARLFLKISKTFQNGSGQWQSRFQFLYSF